MKKLILILLLLAAMNSYSQQYVKVIMNDNSVIEGELYKQTSERYYLKTIGNSSSGTISVLKTDVASIFSVDDNDTNDFKKIVTENEIKAAILDTMPTTPGDELMKAAKKFYIGTALLATGYAVTYIGILNPNLDVKSFVIGGSCIALVGTIVAFTSFANIYKSGKKLNVYMNNNGVTVGLRF